MFNKQSFLQHRNYLLLFALFFFLISCSSDSDSKTTQPEKSLADSTSITLSSSELTLILDDTDLRTAIITATVLPEEASQNVSWSTSDPAIALVDSGTVTAVSTGTAIITATTEDGLFSATCTVTVVISAENISSSSMAEESSSSEVPQSSAITISSSSFSSVASSSSINHSSSSGPTVSSSSSGLSSSSGITVSSSSSSLSSSSIPVSSSSLSVSSSSTPVNVTLPTTVASIDYTKQVGYATLYENGSGVTGGEGANAAHIYVISDAEALRTLLLDRQNIQLGKGWVESKSSYAAKDANSNAFSIDTLPMIIYISGTLAAGSGNNMIDVKNVSNISILGLENATFAANGFNVTNSHNIIIKNLYFESPADDGIQITNASYGVWVDHCAFGYGHDGSVDVKEGSNKVSLTWNHYIGTGKTNLMGHTESNASVDVAITATYAYNHFDKSSSRHPRMRFGTAHIFNNFYESDSTYGVGATCSSHGLVEGNYFYNTRYPLAISYGTSAERPTWSTIDTDMFSNSEVTKGNCTETGYLRESNNYYIYNGLTTTNGNGGPEVLTKDDVSFNWTVPYSYTLLDVQEVPGTIARYAGINILSVNLPTSYNKNTVRYNYSGTVN